MKPKVLEVSAGKLIKDFDDNELRSDAKYKGKVLEVTGKVREVDTEMFDENKFLLHMESDDEWEFLSVTFYDIPKDQLAELETGDRVTVVGDFCDGGDLGVNVKNAHVKG